MFNLFLILAVSSNSDWFNFDKMPTLIVSLISIAIILFATYHKKSRDKFKIREIPGIKAVENAIGRATEMAKPVLFTPG
ncbi:MAG: hypothetical protein DRP35_02550, partial [Candidatus Zixiibacteriota bacterium]